MSLSGPPLPTVPFCQSLSLVPLPLEVFSPRPFALGFVSPTDPGFFDEQLATTSITTILAIAIVIALANVERLFTQPPRPRWTGIIAITLRQSGNNLPVAYHHYIDLRVVSARRAECEVAAVGRPAGIF